MSTSIRIVDSFDLWLFIKFFLYGRHYLIYLFGFFSKSKNNNNNTEKNTQTLSTLNCRSQYVLCSICFCSNYQQIQHLGYAGHEIATESISQQLGLQDKGYEEWVGEMIGMREILRHFANVSVNDVVGMRAPFLKPGRNTQYKVSSSLPSPSHFPLPTSYTHTC